MTELNKKNIDKIIEVISDKNKYFNMGHHSKDDHKNDLDSYETFQIYSNPLYSNPEPKCGTASCICGWANHIRLTENEEISFKYRLSDEVDAAIWLGLDRDEAEELFHGNNADTTDLEDISRGEAIAVLESLKETGKVDWNAESVYNSIR